VLLGNKLIATVTVDIFSSFVSKVSPDDKFFYCGTTTGDILAINMVTNTFQLVGPEKDRFSQGVTSLAVLPSGEFVVGAGDGTICIVGGIESRFKRTKYSQNYVVIHT